MVATKKYPDHGGVMSVQESLYHAVHEFPGGLKKLAERYEWSRGSMLNKLSLEQAKPVPTLENFCQILSATRDPRILTAVCAIAGAVWHAEGEINEFPADMDLLQCGSGMMNALGALIDEIVKGLDDGVLDAAEAARVRQRFFELRKQIVGTEKTVDVFRMEGVEPVKG